MRRSLALPSVGLVCLLLGACGTAVKGSHDGTRKAVGGTATTTTTQNVNGAADRHGAAPPSRRLPVDQDGDNDSSGRQRFDEDDYSVVRYGHPADEADRRAIVSLVKRYYGAAVAHDGRAACALIYSLFAEVIVEDYGSSAGPASLRGNTCRQVMTKFFRSRGRSLVTENATLRVTRVRVHGNRGFALIGFGKTRDHALLVHREFGTWKIGALLATRLG